MRFAVLLLLGVNATFAQGIVDGTVRDGHGAVVPNGSVSLEREEGKTTLSAKTDAEGKFRFTALEAGEYTLKVDADGYYPSSVQFVLRARQPLSLSLEVERKETVRERVEVQAKYLTIDPEKTGSSYVFTRQDLERLAGPDHRKHQRPGEQPDARRQRQPRQFSGGARDGVFAARIRERRFVSGQHAAAVFAGCESATV